MCFLSLSAKDGEGTTFIFLGGLVVTFGLLIVRRFCDEPEELLFLFEELRFFELLELELRELVAVEVVDFGFFLLTSEEDDDFLVVAFNKSCVHVSVFQTLINGIGSTIIPNPQVDSVPF